MKAVKRQRWEISVLLYLLGSLQKLAALVFLLFVLVLPCMPQVPAHWDWREQGKVTPVKNQDGCGACWAFASVAAVESKLLILQNVTMDLSEQELISCTSQFSSCNGGVPSEALGYILRYGIANESSFPYAAQNGTCPGNLPASVARIDGYYSLVDLYGHVPAMQTIREAIYNDGPVLVETHLYSGLYDYTGGVYTPSGSPLGYDAQLIVGYDDPGQYWIMRPAFGTWFGENGYYRLSYNATTGVPSDNAPTDVFLYQYDSLIALERAFILNSLPPVSANPNPVDFGEVSVGSSNWQSVVLTFNSAMTVSQVQTTDDYSVSSNSCSLPYVAAANSTCTLQIQFSPAKPGQRWSPLVVTDSGSNSYTFGLEGVGVGSALAFTPGVMKTVVGTGTAGFAGDGNAASAAELNQPAAVAVDSAGNLYIADQKNQRIRKVDGSGNISTVAGTGTAGFSGGGSAASSAELNQPAAVAVDSAGNLYIADQKNQRIRKVDSSGNISTVAGTGNQGFAGDGGAAYAAELNQPAGVAVDSAGNLYIADRNNQRIRKVDSSGNISTVAGTATAGFAGDGGAAYAAELNQPVAVAVDSAGNLYIADQNNQRIRKVDVTTSMLLFSTINVGQVSAPQTVEISNVGNAPLNFTAPFNFPSNFEWQPIGNDCATGTPLEAGATCNLGVAFAPTAPGNPLTGTVTVNDDAFNSGQAVSLTGATSEVAPTTVAPTVTFTGAPASAAYQSTFTVATTTNASTTAVITASGACSIAGNTVAMTSGMGICSLMANWAADANYTAASLPQSTAATQIAPTVTFTGAPVSAAYGATFNVAATTNASTTAVITASGACSIAGNTVTMTSGMGICSLMASWAADTNYATASLTQYTVATKAPLTVTANNATRQYGQANSTFTGIVTGLVNGDNITATYSTMATPTSTVGSYAITPTLVDPGGKLPNYAVTVNNGTLTVTQATPVIAWTPASIQLGYPLGAAQLDATANVPGTFTYTPPSGTAIMTTSQTLSVLVTPTDTTDYTTANMSISLTVTPGPLASVSPSSINFGTLYLGAIVAKNVTVTNVGNAPMTITGPIFSILHGGDSNEYGAVNLCPKSLAAGKSCTIAVGFVAGPFYNPQTATLSVRDNAPGSPQTVALSATVINPQATLSASSLSFSKQKVGTSSAAKAVTLRNTGTTALTINSIAIGGTNSLDFTQTNNCPGSLAVNAICTMDVAFTPTAVGSRSGSVVITDNTQKSPQIILLSGAGN